MRPSLKQSLVTSAWLNQQCLGGVGGAGARDESLRDLE